MIDDSGVQVWLDTVGSRPIAITPYVQSEQPATLRYRVEVSQRSQGSRSRIAQSGTVSVLSDVPAPLSRFSLSSRPDGECRIEVTLTSTDKKERRYVFDCPN
jgi:hypothetical protein